MAETQNLQLGIYDANTDGKIKYIDYFTSTNSNMTKIDNAYGKLQQDIQNIDVSEQVEVHNTSDMSHEDIRNLMGQLSSLTTEEKINLVVAINEVKSQSNEIEIDATQRQLQVRKVCTSDEDYKTHSILTIFASTFIPSWLPTGSDPYGTYRRTGQIGYCFVHEFVSVSGVSYYQTNNVPVANGWKRLATTDKIDVLCTPQTGFKIYTQNCCKINNIVYLNIEFRKADDTPFGVQYMPCITIPSGLNPAGRIISLTFSGLSAGTVSDGTGNAMALGSNIWVACTKETTVRGFITGVIIL